MKVYNKNKTEILIGYDLTKGYLKEDILIVKIPETKEIKEKSHYETVKEYPNGGKDVIKVIDIAGVKGIPAHEEKEKIMVYIPYTEKELAEKNKNNHIIELKRLLAQSDYKVIKYYEKELEESEFVKIKEERKKWREEIRLLENR